VQQKPIQFALLTHEDFAKLSTEEKIMYLARAMEALAEERGSVFAGPPEQSTYTLQ
jgi:hypothetical protein